MKYILIFLIISLYPHKANASIEIKKGETFLIFTRDQNANYYIDSNTISNDTYLPFNLVITAGKPGKIKITYNPKPYRYEYRLLSFETSIPNLLSYKIGEEISLAKTVIQSTQSYSCKISKERTFYVLIGSYECLKKLYLIFNDNLIYDTTDFTTYSSKLIKNSPLGPIKKSYYEFLKNKEIEEQKAADLQRKKDEEALKHEE